MTVKTYKSLTVKMPDGTNIRIPKRGIQMLDMLDNGRSNRGIAEALDLSEHTVKVHMWRLFGRIGVNSRGAAAKWWRDHRPASTTTNALRAFFDGVCVAMDAGRITDDQIAYLRKHVEDSMRGMP